MGSEVRWRRYAALMAVVVVLGGSVALLVSGGEDAPSVGSHLLAHLGVLAVPDQGDAEPGVLDDGRPVFVVHDLDGSVHVVDAISSHIALDQMAWCPSSRTIDDVFHGARWDAQGRYVSGPGRLDLGRYTFELVDGGTRVVSQAYVEPATRSTVSDGMAGPDCVDGGYLIHPYHADAPELWPTDGAWERFANYVGSAPPLLLEQADQAEWTSRAMSFGLDHCASLRLDGPSRYSPEYASEKEAAWIAAGESTDRPAGPAQTEILYVQVADQAAERFLCPDLANR